VQRKAPDRAVLRAANESSAGLPAPLADARLNAICANRLSKFYGRSFGDSVGYLDERGMATLRRAVRMAPEMEADRSPPRKCVLLRETRYSEAEPQPLRDVAPLILNTSLKLGEVLAVLWADVHVQPVLTAPGMAVRVCGRELEYALRALPLTAAIRTVLEQHRGFCAVNVAPFPRPTIPIRHIAGRRLDHMLAELLRGNLGLPREFVLHSLRHRLLSRLGESGADAFTLQRVAGYDSIVLRGMCIRLAMAWKRLLLSSTPCPGRHSREPNRHL
jgi:hypothetical protein